MWRSDFQYYAAFESSDGGHIGDARLDVDWIPALRWEEFEQGLLNDCMPDDRSAHPVIEPEWSPHFDRPYICGIKIRRAQKSDAVVSFPLTYFSSAVIAASGELVASGRLSRCAQFNFKVFALADAQRQEPDSRINVVAVAERPAIGHMEMAPLVATAEAHVENAVVPGNGSSQPVATAMRIFVNQQAIDEATELAQRADEIETGGIFVGNLCRDSKGTLFCRVTAQIPAEHTTATRESLRFTPETWASVDRAIRLRGRGEISVGWWHSHPFFCRQCLPQQRAVCPLSAPHFSAADRDLHREVFQKPWSIALLLSFLGGERPRCDIFAWNHGQIEAAEYFTLPDSAGVSGEIS